MIVNHKSWQREMVLVLFGSGSEQEFVSKICTQMASDWRRLSGILCLPGCIQVRVVPHLPGEGLQIISELLSPLPSPPAALDLDCGVPDLGGHCRTSTRVKQNARENARIDARKNARIECQNGCQIERQNKMSDRMQGHNMRQKKPEKMPEQMLERMPEQDVRMDARQNARKE